MIIRIVIVSPCCPPGLRHGGDQFHERLVAVRIAFLEIVFNQSHCVGDVRETNNRFAPGLREAIERRRLHFDRQQALGPRERKGCLGLPERGIGRPYPATGQRQGICQPGFKICKEGGIYARIGGGG